MRQNLASHNGTDLQKQFEDSYRISNRKLGSGAHGTVYMAVKRCYGRQLACKIINLSDLRRQESEKLMKGREFMELKKFRFYKRTADNESSTDASVKRLNETVDRKVEEYIDKLSREVEILKNLCHVRNLYESYDSSDTSPSPT